MNSESFVKTLVDNTQETYSMHYSRLAFISKTLILIQNKHEEDKNVPVVVDEKIYTFDEYIKLYFEFTILISLFPQFKYAQSDFEVFLCTHLDRLNKLLNNGELSHLNPLINFRNLVQY